ncbi:MAG: putative LPS assembly protein LptD [bacterium]
MKFVRCLLLVLVALMGVSWAVRAQVPTRSPVRPPVTRADSLRAKADSLRPKGDTASAKDTVARANFVEPDSVMQRLQGLKGYTVTQYQGGTITFDAVSRAIELAKHAIVVRDSQLVKSDTIKYNGTGSSIRVGSDSNKRNNVFAAPGQAPVLSSGSGSYNIESRRASVGGVKTSIPENGQTLNITGERVAIAAGKDSVRSANDATYYLQNGTVTACDDSVPDYYFKANEIKRTGSFVVARPAVLYIGDVPVMWLPFLFQDIRNGRHSGIIAPNIGVSDFIRNSPSYRRNVEGIGYYFAISDYIDAQASFDWRSGAGEALQGDRGYTRYNGEMRYRWLEKYVDGSLALSHTNTGDQTNTAISWAHREAFTKNSALSTNINYVTSTSLQRQTTVNPYSALATISSQANYQQKLGPAQVSLGFNQKQYPGRSQLDRTFPTVSFTTSAISPVSWLTWTPSVNYTSTLSSGIDQPTSLGLLQRLGKTAAGIDTIFGDTLKRSATTSSLNFDSPIQVFGYNLGQSISISAAHNDFPERAIVSDVVTGEPTERIYAQTYKTEINYNPQFTLPPVARNLFNLSPSVALSNVDGGPLCVRNERTGGKFVCQSKRLTYGLSAAPTLFGLFSGFGPFTRLRHSISPTFGYTYSGARDVSDEYLTALGRTRYSPSGRSDYLPALAQNALSFGLSTNIEAKLRSPNDSNPEAGEKIKLVSLTFTSLNYDFERARFTHKASSGLTTQDFGYNLRSDLLPGIDIGVNYSLFQGSNVSDTAVFKPYRERITGSFSFSNSNNPLAVFAKMFGKSDASNTLTSERNQPPQDDPYARQVASQSVAGRAARTAAFLPTATQGWQASFTFTSARQRPPTGNLSNVVAFDPATRCTQFNTVLLKLQYDQCVANQRTNPSPDTPITSGLVGSPIYLTPPTTSLGSNVNFNLTEHWAATWQTQYDFEAHNFASQIVSLSRDLHDWRAIFAFTQSPNGSFAFNFLISLKAEPQLKFDYHKSTFRNEGFQ